MSRQDINTSSHMNDKREQFEAQLRSLQCDIGQLSQKLSIPIATIPTGTSGTGTSGMNSSGSIASSGSQPDHHMHPFNNSEYYSHQHSLTHSHTQSHSQQQSGAKPVKKNVSFDNTSTKAAGAGASTSASLLSQKKAEVVRLSKELRTVSRERDDLHYRHEQLKRETEDIKKTLSDFGRLRSLCENLQQDNDSLKMSLESSEKIRKQQKELIVMMQRSTQYTIENSSQASSIHHNQSGQLNSSMNSFGGASSVTDRSVGSHPISGSVSFAPSAASVTEEHREWLNTRPAPSFHPGPVGGGQHIPAMVLASPAASAVPKYKATVDTSAPVQKLTRKATTPKAAKSSSSKGVSSKTGSSITTKPRTTKRGAATDSSASVRSSSSVSKVKKTVSKTGTTSKKTTIKGKKVSKTASRKDADNHANHVQADAHGYGSAASVGSHSTSGVMSYDRIMTSSNIGTDSPYAYSASQILQPTTHQESGKPPRAPARRPVSANSASRGRRPKSHEEHLTTRALRSHSLTSEPLSLSQFNILHSPYRSRTNGGKRTTHMSARRGQK